MQALRSIFNYIVRDIKVGLALLCTELNELIQTLEDYHGKEADSSHSAAGGEQGSTWL